ncbi:MAG: hypothetical protein ACR65W_07470 [Methylocystis sp.]|uniref:hypothetical protein n=1 Tax=Methylocystis sp. TaxID=1911079 RepID=UPI003DA3C03F
MTSGWIQHGDSNQRDLVKMLLPERGVHFMVSDDEDAARALTAELAVMVAGGDLASMQSGGGKSFRLQRGFMNLPTGKPRAVSAVGATDMDHIKLAAALRNINTRLPIYVREDAKCDLAANGFGYKLRENDIALAIVAVDVGEKDGLELVRRYGMFSNEVAILIVTKSEPPKNLLYRETRVMRIVEGKGEDQFTLTVDCEALKPGWSRELSLEAVDLGDGRMAWGVRNVTAGASAPQLAPATPKPAQAEREAHAGVVIYAVGSGTFGLSQDEIASWPAGTNFASTPEAVVEAVREVHGRVRVVVATVAGSKAGVAEEARRARTALEAAHLAGVCTVEVLERKLQDVRAA